MDWLLFLIVLDIIVLLAAYSLAISTKLYPTIYQTFYLKQYDKNYSSSPDISIFIPCKGITDHFEDNIYAFLNSHYHKAKLFFIVENKDDLAYPIIKKSIENRPDAHLVIAGLTTSCGQKNHNLLQGIKASGEKDEVYVFFDLYTTITAQQLQDLVLPLSDPNVTVAVGFRWNILREKTLGERLHAFMIALQWSIMNCVFVPAVWGGAAAIRREDFENMRVQEYWAKTVVDDMSLQSILQKKRKKSVFVPTCVKETNNTLKNINAAFLWFKRQALYVKFYLRTYWLLILGLLVCCSANIVSFPFLLISSIICPGKKIFLFTGVTGIFIVFAMISCLLLKRSANDNHSKLSWLLLSPLYLVLTCYACLLSIFTNVLHWRGISYYLDYHGYVKKIVRTEQ